jgi:hypothetical protein
MKILKVLDTKLILADIEVNLGKQMRHAVTLCAKYNGKVIPLNTADGRPILMTEENALIDLDEIDGMNEIDEDNLPG